MSGLFERSSSGSLNADSVLECGVCWWVYDPAVGDEDADLVPGVPFAMLPDDFCCPSCDATKDKFMLQTGGLSGDSQTDKESLEDRVNALVAAFEKAEEQMVGLPVHNPRLHVQAIGFSLHQERYVGIIITPWCMNIVSLSKSSHDMPSGPIGSTQTLVFPSGSYSFIAGRMDDLGALDQCSLFSPMDAFENQDAAVLAAEAALSGLMQAPEPPAKKEISRRALFGRREDTDSGEAALP